jgi:hypothetical protein
MTIDREYHIVVPKFDNARQMLGSGAFSEHFERIQNQFGGFTLIPKTYGCWFNPEKKKAECEENFMISMTRIIDQNDMENMSRKAINKIHRDDATFVADMSKQMGLEYGQGAIMISEMECNATMTSCKWEPKVSKEVLHKWAQLKNVAIEDILYK